MTLGDLFVRQGETFQALEYFERLAKIFLNDGFTTKAIAIYKKVAKLAPEESRPLERLAELYVQQGVLSEARPIYLQLAEAQLKAGRQPQAAVLLRKLLEAEPDNLRVQTRLAELHLSMGQQKEAIETFHSAMQRVLEQGDHAEAIRLADRILQLDPGHQADFSVEGPRPLRQQAEVPTPRNLLEIPAGPGCGRRDDHDVAGPVFGERPAGKSRRARGKRFCAGPEELSRLRIASRPCCSKPATWTAREALLALIRDTMIDSGDHEVLAQSISRLAENRPGQIEPLEWLVDLYGRASDSFRLPGRAGATRARATRMRETIQRALATYEQLLERTPEDETTRRKYHALARQDSASNRCPEEISPPVKLASEEPQKTLQLPLLPPNRRSRKRRNGTSRKP